MTQIISFNHYNIDPCCNNKSFSLYSKDSSLKNKIDIEEVKEKINEMFSDKEFLSIEEFSRFFSVCYETIRKRLADGEIAYITIGKKKVIPKSEILRLIKQGGI